MNIEHVTTQEALELGRECATECRAWLFGGARWCGEGVPLGAYNCRHRDFYTEENVEEGSEAFQFFCTGYCGTAVILIRARMQSVHHN